MPKPPALTDTQKSRLAILEPALRAAVYAGDYEQAKDLVRDIQLLLRATGHETRLMRSKTWLFEAALNAGELLTAEAGFRGVCAKTAETTRVHLEAKALLVVCLIRQKKISEAEPLIAKVLQGKSIKDMARRRSFIETVTTRYHLESYVAAVRNRLYEPLLPDAIDAEAIEAVKHKSDDELYAQIATALPRDVVEFVFRVDRASREKLTLTEVLYLPAPAMLEKKAVQGRSFFASLKLVIWKSLCDPQSDIYKAWYTNGMSHFFSKKYYAIVVSATLIDLGFAVKAVAVPVTALLMKLGLEVYCDRYKPGEILDNRNGNGV